MFARSAHLGTACPVRLGRDGGTLLLCGAGGSHEGDVPFLDTFDMRRPPPAAGDSRGAGSEGDVGRVVDARSRRG